jgi:DsbC/DsbD-like thiol-disulfide interchange protein
MIEGVPAFTFTCEVQEFDAKVHVETGEPYYYVPATPESEAQEASEAQEEDPENNSKSEKAKAAYQKLKSRFATNPSEAAKKPRVIKSTYSMTLVRHEEPDIELAGHYWQFIEF